MQVYNSANEAKQAGRAPEPSVDELVGSVQSNDAPSMVKEAATPFTNGHSEAVEEAKANGARLEEPPSIQSPASALADTLSELSLATPAPKQHLPSRLQAVSQRHVEKMTAEEPVAPVASDRPVGLVYDKIMEEHVGPSSMALYSLQPHLLCNLTAVLLALCMSSYIMSACTAG